MTSEIKDTNKKNPKVLRGIVVSDAMDKTVVVKVDRFIQHPMYKKFYTKSAKHKAHDPENQYKVDDVVEIVSVRPISKDKHFLVRGIATTKA